MTIGRVEELGGVRSEYSWFNGSPRLRLQSTMHLHLDAVPQQSTIGTWQQAPQGVNRNRSKGASIWAVCSAPGNLRAAIQPVSHATWRTKHAIGGASARTLLVAAADTASPQIVRKRSGRDPEQSTTANDDKSAFMQVKATFPTRTNNGQ